MDYIKRTIIEILLRHKGQKNAITEPLLIETLKEHNINLCGSVLRANIAELVLECEELIVSSVKGFYIAETENEYLKGIRWLKARINPIVKRIKRMEYLRDEYFGSQMKLNL